MTELKKIAYAKTFIDKLADGVNPLDDSQIPDSDLVNNVRISRCFYYVSEILRQVIDNGGVNTKKSHRRGREEFSLTDDQYGTLQVGEIPVNVSEISDQVNKLIDTESMKKLPAAAITDWLAHIGALEIVTKANGKHSKIPTEIGRSLGIFTEERMGQYGAYNIVFYSTDAQKFIIDNLPAIIAYRKDKKSNITQ